MVTGFFAPASVSSDYVKNKRSATGSYAYDDAISQVGLQKQTAFSTLNKQYGTTINNAYANYLAANRGIVGSQIGEGYKDAYKLMQQEQLESNIIETNMSAAEARQQLNAQEAEGVGNIYEQYIAEIANMDRVSASLGEYMNYVSSLTDKENKPYLSDEWYDTETGQFTGELDDFYDLVYGGNIQVEGAGNYTDVEGNSGLNYLNWITKNYGNTEADAEWYKWLTSGGYKQFGDAVGKGIKPL